jgi:arylsulfatase A-like enzyme
MNVILLSIDSLRADMPWSGYPRAIAPRLTALEAKSVSYTHAYAVSSYTAMSLGGLLAGRYPSSLGRDGFYFVAYAKDSPFIPKLLQKSGVRTLGAQAHGYFKSAGFENGFDTWELVPNLKWNNTTDENVTGPQHEAIAERLLSDPKLDTSRFFAWFHFLDPHDQYMAHDADGIPPFGKTLRDKYDAEVLFTDQQIGKLLDFMAQKSWFSRTVLIITSDHGEAFGEHNQFSHGFELWENLVRVPLMFVVPGVPPRRIDTHPRVSASGPLRLERCARPGRTPYPPRERSGDR